MCSASTVPATGEASLPAHTHGRKGRRTLLAGGSSRGTASGSTTDPWERTLVSTGPTGGVAVDVPVCLARVLQGAIISEREVTVDLTSSKIIHVKPNAKEKNTISQIEKILLRRVGASPHSNWQHNHPSETLLRRLCGHSRG